LKQYRGPTKQVTITCHPGPHVAGRADDLRPSRLDDLTLLAGRQPGLALHPSAGTALATEPRPDFGTDRRPP